MDAQVGLCQYCLQTPRPGFLTSRPISNIELLLIIKWAAIQENLALGESKIKTGLLSYRDYLEKINFAHSKSRYDIFQLVNNKDSDQTARMPRLICVFVVPKQQNKQQKTDFLT